MRVEPAALQIDTALAGIVTGNTNMLVTYVHAAAKPAAKVRAPLSQSSMPPSCSLFIKPVPTFNSQVIVAMLLYTVPRPLSPVAAGTLNSSLDGF